jgi:hypothetical protein
MNRDLIPVGPDCQAEMQVSICVIAVERAAGGAIRPDP